MYTTGAAYVHAVLTSGQDVYIKGHARKSGFMQGNTFIVKEHTASGVETSV